MEESNKRLKTKRNIENAMVQLLMDHPFDQITTIKLAEKAGISRSSFYTHYKDKYDMIEHYQSKLFHTFEYIFQKHAHHKKDTKCRAGFHIQLNLCVYGCAVSEKSV